MIHYSCDLCRRKLDPNDDLRYVVKIEVSAAFDPTTTEDEDDRNHLQEIQDILERLEDDGDGVGAEIYQKMQFDLCPECRGSFAKHPLGRVQSAKILDFSKN